MFSREEMQALADIAIRHDLIVISDEVYEWMVLDSQEHIHFATLDGYGNSLTQSLPALSNY